MGNIKAYLEKLNIKSLPSAAAEYLKEELLSDSDLDLLGDDNKLVIEAKELIDSKYPEATKEETVVKEFIPEVEVSKEKHIEPTPVKPTTPSETKKSKKKEYKEAIEALQVMVDISKGKEKKEYKEAIEAYRVMADMEAEEFKNGGSVRGLKEINALLQEARKKVEKLTPKEITEMWNTEAGAVAGGISEPLKLEEVEKSPTHYRTYLKDLLFEKQLTEPEYETYFEYGGTVKGKYDSNKNKTWIVSINMPLETPGKYKIRKEEFILGRLSDEEDVKQAILRKQHGSGGEFLGNGRVVSIVEKKEDGGEVEIHVGQEGMFRGSEVKIVTIDDDNVHYWELDDVGSIKGDMRKVSTEEFKDNFTAFPETREEGLRDAHISENRYSGHTPEQVWKEWTPKQREHFLIDHNFNTSPSKYKMNDFILSDELPISVQYRLEEHMFNGQYKKGGSVENEIPIKRIIAQIENIVGQEEVKTKTIDSRDLWNVFTKKFQHIDTNEAIRELQKQGWNITGDFNMPQFTATIHFNKGDKVFDKEHNTNATILDNYGNSLEGDRGEVKTDMDGNVPIFTYDEKSNRVGYNLKKLTGKPLPEKGTPEYHKLQIAKRTVRMHPAIVGVMGGMSYDKALETLIEYGIEYKGEKMGFGGAVKELFIPSKKEHAIEFSETEFKKLSDDDDFFTKRKEHGIWDVFSVYNESKPAARYESGKLIIIGHQEELEKWLKENGHEVPKFEEGGVIETEVYIHKPKGQKHYVLIKLEDSEPYNMEMFTTEAKAKKYAKEHKLKIVKVTRTYV